MPESGLHLSFHGGFGLGGAEASTSLHHSAFGVFAEADLWATRYLGVAGGYHYMVAPGWPNAGAQLEDGEPSSPLRLSLPALGLRVRFFSDETAREGFRFSFDGGPLLGSRSGGMLRVHLAREFGAFHSSTSAAALEIGIGYAQGLGDAEDIRIAMVTLGGLYEIGVPEPLDIDEFEAPPRLIYTAGAELIMIGRYFDVPGTDGLSLGAGINVGFPTHFVVEPRLHIDLQYTKNRDILIASTAGLRFRFNRWFPIFADGAIGYATVFGAAQAQLDYGPIADVGLGTRLASEAIAGDIGVRYRRGIGTRNRDFDALMLVVGVEYGSHEGALGSGPITAEPSRPRRPPPRVQRVEPGPTARATELVTEGETQVSTTSTTVVTIPFASLSPSTLRGLLGDVGAIPLRVKLRSTTAERAHLESEIHRVFAAGGLAIEQLHFEPTREPPAILITLPSAEF